MNVHDFKNPTTVSVLVNTDTTLKYRWVFVHTISSEHIQTA